ncbi:MAG: AI-2E family transporter [Patescibacteria group bacterium]
MALDISVNTIFKILIVLLGLWFVFVIRDIIAIIFAALIVTAALSPVVDRMAKSGIPRVLTILVAYLLLIGLIGVLVYFILPPAITQLRQLADQLPSYFSYFQNLVNNIREFGLENHLITDSQSGINAVSDFLNNFTSNLFNTTRGFISSFTAVLTVFVLTLYLLLDENGIKNFFVALLPVKQKSQLVNIANKIGSGLGAWLRGQLLLGVIVGLMVYIGLIIIGVPYALTLALLAGVLEIIPIIGPIISAIPAILIALSISPTMALIVTGFYILTQELENKLLVPKVMQRTVGLHPVTIIIVLLIGAKLMGVLGILLAVPIASVFYIILKEWSRIARPARSR